MEFLLVVALLLLMLVPAGVVVSLPTFFLWWLWRRRGRPFQFSLRGLFLAVTLVALVLGGIGWWGAVNLAQVRWLNPASPEAAGLFPASEVVKNDDGEWSMVYCSECRTIGGLHETLNAALAKMGDYSCRSDDNLSRVAVACADRNAVEECLADLRKADKLGPGEMVIRGRVEDSAGQPVAGAIVDLMGPYVYINHFQTREDGTFVMPVKPPGGWGYYLRIRPRDREAKNTGRFSLSYDEPERVVIVRLP